MWGKPQNIFAPIAIKITDVRGEVSVDVLRQGEYFNVVTRVIREIPHLFGLGVLGVLGAQRMTSTIPEYIVGAVIVESTDEGFEESRGIKAKRAEVSGAA